MVRPYDKKDFQEIDVNEDGHLIVYVCIGCGQQFSKEGINSGRAFEQNSHFPNCSTDAIDAEYEWLNRDKRVDNAGV